jgi:hypothetical protein
LQALLPAAFFDAVFTIVRHPVSRIVSAYHFQAEVYRSAACEAGFSDWFRTQARAFEEDPFILDNHFRPQVDFIPAECRIFHLEHGLDALVPYIDGLVGNQDGPRFVSHVNQRGGGKSSKPDASVTPSSADIALIEQIYAADFARFGYAADRREPMAPKPALAPEFLAANAVERARMDRPLNRIAARVRRKIGI